MMAARHPDFLSRRSVKAIPLALCLSLERWLDLVALQRWTTVCAGGLPLQEWEGRKRRGTGLLRRRRRCQALSQCEFFEAYPK